MEQAVAILWHLQGIKTCSESRKPQRNKTAVLEHGERQTNRQFPFDCRAFCWLHSCDFYAQISSLIIVTCRYKKDFGGQTTFEQNLIL